MQRKVISAAIAAACAGAAAPALALVPNATFPGTVLNPAVTNVTFLSGATAQDNQIVAFLRRACTSGSLDVFANGTPPGTPATAAVPTSLRLFACDKGSTSIIPAFSGGITQMLVHKASGGSGQGVTPILNGTTTVAYLNFTALTTSICSSSNVAAVGTVLPAYRWWNCGATAPTFNGTVPEIGVSDVEPRLLSTLSTTGVTVRPTSVVTFGVPVTRNLRDALQTLQIANGGLPGGCAGVDSEACMPSLGKDQITGIYAGSYADATQFGLPAPGSGDTTIYLSRRPASSGSQATTEIFFTGQRCSRFATTVSFVSGSVPNDPTNAATACNGATAPLVYVGQGTENVLQCLNNHQAQGRYAVGLASLEFGAPEFGNGWRFVKIDGYAPSVYNVQRGLYHFWSEATFQYRTATLLGNDLVFANGLDAQLASPLAIAALNSDFNHSDWGPLGVAGLLTPASTPGASIFGSTGTLNPSVAQAIAFPIASSSKSQAGGSPNNCQTPFGFQDIQPRD